MLGNHGWVVEIISRTVFDTQLVLRSSNDFTHRQLRDPPSVQKSYDYLVRIHLRGCLIVAGQIADRILSYECGNVDDGSGVYD